MYKNTLPVIIAIVVFLGGCTLAPKYKQPKAPVPDKWPQGDVYKKAGVSKEAREDFFADPGLKAIVRMALKNNRDLRLAALNVERARALYGVQRAELFPAVSAVGSGAKQRSSSDLTRPGVPRTTKQFSVNLGITSWEIDFFGRIRSLKEQALEEYLATEQARRSAQIALVAEVARAYLALAADRGNLKLARSTLDTQQGIYDLIRRQYEVGLANELDLRRAQTQVDAARGDVARLMRLVAQDPARGDVARLMRLVAQDRNALNLLAGSPAPEDLLPTDLASVSPLRDISPGLSSEVLLRRPDIMAAEHQLKAAYAFIGAARAAFFPRISPALRVSKTVRKIALTQYEKVIQTAFREVADSLAAQGTVDRQVKAQQSLVNALAETHRLSVNRYTNGIDSYLGVLDAQRTLYAARQGLIALRLAKLANQVRLYAVLGGGGHQPGEHQGGS